MAKAKAGAKKAKTVDKKHASVSKDRPTKQAALQKATASTKKPRVVEAPAAEKPAVTPKRKDVTGTMTKPAVKKARAADESTATATAKVKTKATGKPKKLTAVEGSDARPKRDPTFLGPIPDKPAPRATKLPAIGVPLTKREMEQLLTAGVGRGVEGEGSLKGRVHLRDGFPYLHVVGRDKRELVFLLQGPEQEVFPAYDGQKFSVSGLIKKTSNYGGTVDVRRYTAARQSEDSLAEAAPLVEHKLKYLSPGEVEQVYAGGMGAGMRGFASLRGALEMTGEAYFLVLSNAGTRQQVAFTLSGSALGDIKRLVGQVVLAHGVVEKSTGWGGTIAVESVEARTSEFRALSRDAMEVCSIEAVDEPMTAEVKLNQGLSVRLEERPGFVWAVEPAVAKRVGLREANFEAASEGAARREFFFTPRNPGTFEVEFFLAKAFSPANVAKTFKLALTVRV